MKELTDSVMKIAELAAVFGDYYKSADFGQKDNRICTRFFGVRQIKSGKEITCVFEFADGKHPIVAYLMKVTLDVAKIILLDNPICYVKLFVKYLRGKVSSWMKFLTISRSYS